uniref:DUF1464 domain-containing protein n=1 Tax=candidate division WOR-3 bacterium TaxID=2052148 RepID=A0A7V4E2C0_UNCW3
MANLKVIGVDPGTRSFDILGMVDGAPLLELSFPSGVVADNPSYIVDKMLEFSPDIIIAPSGYGVPLKRIDELTPKDRFCLTLELEKDKNRIPVLKGLQEMVDILKEKFPETYFIPSVILLPSVPEWRKFNKIDMGTADKLAIGVLAIYMESLRKNISYKDVSFVMVEIGYGYNAALLVKDGRIIDGIGGTLFPGPSFLSIGSMDAELAYLLQNFTKETLFRGGIKDIIGNINDIDEIEKNPHRGKAMLAFKEGILKAIYQLFSIYEPETIILSGRLTRNSFIINDLIDLIKNKTNKEIVILKGFAKKVKEAAQGSAIIGDGILGGKFKDIVDWTLIKEATGNVLSYIKIKNEANFY